MKYDGSGKYWKRHKEKHGDEIETVWVSDVFNDRDDLIEFALFFSEFNDIVASKRWANLAPENGLDGTTPGTKFKDRKRSRESERWINNGKKQKMIHEDDLPEYLFNGWVQGRLISEDWELKNKTKVLGHKWMNKGADSKQVNANEIESFLQNGWVIGRGSMSPDQRIKLKQVREGRVWINNTKTTTIIPASELEAYLKQGWSKGRR